LVTWEVSAYLLTVSWATEVSGITEQEVEAQVGMYPDEGGGVAVQSSLISVDAGYMSSDLEL